MAVAVVIGSQWGDEGKGKIVDLLGGEVDIVARYQGGANAGHTIMWGEETFILHLLPSGVFREGVGCVIGNGVVIDPLALAEEIKMVEAMGFEVEGRLLVSDKAHLILPYHKAIERARERARAAGAIGTTGRGIGPAYVDKAGRKGIRVVDLLDRDVLSRKLRVAVEENNVVLQKVYGAEKLDAEQIVQEYVAFDQLIAPYITDTSAYLNAALKRGKRVLAEGAQGALLDVDFGSYPFVTSSNPTAGGACTGLGIPPTSVDRIIGVVKAYSTRVGNGPFPTEISGEVGERMRKFGMEFGATTGRPRRCGWLDLVALRYTSSICGFTDLAVTKLDVLSGIDPIRVCIGYRQCGRQLAHYPSDVGALRIVEPAYRDLPGWSEDFSGARDYDSLPVAAQKLVSFIARTVGVEVSMISTGPKRSETIAVNISP